MAINQTGIADSIQTIVMSQKHDGIIRWLNASDPSSNHELARKKPEPTSGEWFINSDGFKSWTESTNKFLWLLGIPGAGKTILCSTIIEHVKALCSTNSAYQICIFLF